MRSALISSAVAAIISANSALALESNLTVLSSLSAADLWSKIGDFCGLSHGTPQLSGVNDPVLWRDWKSRRRRLGTTPIAALVGRVVLDCPDFKLSRKGQCARRRPDFGFEVDRELRG